MLVPKNTLLKVFLDKKYPKYKEDKGQNFLQDLSELINNDTVQYVGKGTLKKDQYLVNIYRGNGITLVTKDPNEYVTVLKSGKAWIWVLILWSQLRETYCRYNKKQSINRLFSGWFGSF